MNAKGSNSRQATAQDTDHSTSHSRSLIRVLGPLLLLLPLVTPSTLLPSK